MDILTYKEVCELTFGYKQSDEALTAVDQFATYFENKQKQVAAALREYHCRLKQRLNDVVTDLTEPPLCINQLALSHVSLRRVVISCAERHDGVFLFSVSVSFCDVSVDVTKLIDDFRIVANYVAKTTGPLWYVCGLDAADVYFDLRKYGWIFFDSNNNGSAYISSCGIVVDPSL